MFSNRKNIYDFIKTKAEKLGFNHCGIAKAGFLEEDAPRLEKWLKNNFNGEMSYMANHIDLRLDPRKLLPGTQTVVTVLKNYYSDFVQDDGLPKISKYAYGKDYHKIIKKQLAELLNDLQQFGEINGRAFVDSAPILERSWAVKSGLGWIGKNGMLIQKGAGSFFFIGILLLDIDLPADNVLQSDHCGSCTRCIDACPTDAILPDKTIKADSCISYYTIELKSMEIQMDKKWNDWIFGCDVCQDVCPWNRFSIKHTEDAFSPRFDILNKSKEEWEQMTQEAFDTLSQSSPIKRAKLEGMKRNIKFLYSND